MPPSSRLSLRRSSRRKSKPDKWIVPTANEDHLGKGTPSPSPHGVDADITTPQTERWSLRSSAPATPKRMSDSTTNCNEDKMTTNILSPNRAVVEVTKGQEEQLSRITSSSSGDDDAAIENTTQTRRWSLRSKTPATPKRKSNTTKNCNEDKMTTKILSPKRAVVEVKKGQEEQLSRITSSSSGDGDDAIENTPRNGRWSLRSSAPATPGRLSDVTNKCTDAKTRMNSLSPKRAVVEVKEGRRYLRRVDCSDDDVVEDDDDAADTNEICQSPPKRQRVTRSRRGKVVTSDDVETSNGTVGKSMKRPNAPTVTEKAEKDAAPRKRKATKPENKSFKALKSESPTDNESKKPSKPSERAIKSEEKSTDEPSKAKPRTKKKGKSAEVGSKTTATTKTRKNAKSVKREKSTAPAGKTVATSKTKKIVKPPRKGVTKKEQCIEIITESSSSAAGTSAAASASGGKPDGKGGLNQPNTFSVSYSSSSRATCRRCDERIDKGVIRISHRPLFRGKPGYQVYRHLKCAVFSEDVKYVHQIDGYDDLDDEDLVALEIRISESLVEVKKEMEELEPDELVPVTFQGPLLPPPPGLTATMLPFQVEGVSWMNNQEIGTDLRGGILADEMGMGKTLQTIAATLCNRPKLQHAKPGAKFPPSSSSSDLAKLTAEDSQWNNALQEWAHEMKMQNVLNVPERPTRGGTLVVCPIIALSQWKSEIEKFSAAGALSVRIYHGPHRATECPLELLSKYDVVLTTYQVIERDMGKMVSPNKVKCPNCGKKFKIDKLQIHLKYFCGEGAVRTEAQARQRRGARRRGRGGRSDPPPADDESGNDDDAQPKKGTKKKKKMLDVPNMKKKTSRSTSATAKMTPLKNSHSDSDSDDDVPPSVKSKRIREKKKTSVTPKFVEDELEQRVSSSSRRGVRKPKAKAASIMSKTKTVALDDSDEDKASKSVAVGNTRRRSSRAAASRTMERLSQSLVDSGNSNDDDDDDDSNVSKNDDDEYQSSDGVSSSSEELHNSEYDDSDDDSSAPLASLKSSKKAKKQYSTSSSSEESDSGDDFETRAAITAKQGKALERAKNQNKKFPPKKKHISKKASKKNAPPPLNMEALLKSSQKNAVISPLHSITWWRIVLDEAHMIKTRSSQTAQSAFALTGIHRWCLSGTPLQNRVGEFYSLVRFLRIDRMAHYFCRSKGCTCKNLHYRMLNGKCQDCGHSSINHYSYFNRTVLNPIQRDGYCGDGRRAMFTLKNEVLDKCLLRRTKETRAEDMALPPRLVEIKTVALHPIEEDFYNALYTQTKSSFDDYVTDGTLLNNYAHIFDLLIRMRQSVDHPYLVLFTKSKNRNVATLTNTTTVQQPAISNGTITCDICHEEPTNRIVSTCCQQGYCRACVMEYLSTSAGIGNEGSATPCPSCRAPFSIDLNQADAENENTNDKPSRTETQTAKITKTSPQVNEAMPSLKEMPHVASTSILRRINLAEFATSTKIEALIQDLVQMRTTSPGSKAIVFSQFVNMLDLIRWRLHSDPCLSDLGLGVVTLQGSMNVKVRDENLRKFREEGNVRVLLISLKAGGVALNLTVANHIYLMDPWWNPAAEMQAIDRTHRMGQYRPIRAVRFIAENTVEERILQLQEKKRLVFDGTVGRDASSLTMLSVDDMKSLFV